MTLSLNLYILCGQMLHLNENLTGEVFPATCANIGEGISDNADDVEAILLEHLQSGNRAALFPLGQFYYEQVTGGLLFCCCYLIALWPAGPAVHF